MGPERGGLPFLSGAGTQDGRTGGLAWSVHRRKLRGDEDHASADCRYRPWLCDGGGPRWHLGHGLSANGKLGMSNPRQGHGAARLVVWVAVAARSITTCGCCSHLDLQFLQNCRPLTWNWEAVTVGRSLLGTN